MNLSSIRNNTANIKITSTNEEEQLCSELSKEVYNGTSSDILLEKINIHLKKLSTDKNKQIDFLEKAFSSCDVIQPFGKQPVNIKVILDDIKKIIQNLSSSYFTLTDKIFEKINIKDTLDSAVMKLTENSNTTTIAKKLLQETNKKGYIKNIYLKQEINNGSIISNRILTLSTERKYELQPTRGEANNCLIYAITKGAKNNINRTQIFTKENIEHQIIQIYDNSKSDYMTDDENFANLKQIVTSIYNDASDILGPTTDISQLASALLNHVNTSNCFLDSQIAASILAMKFKQNIVIITPNNENASKFTYQVINNKGTMSHSGELSKENLKKIENNSNNLFIYNHGGIHFEWLKYI